jgi:phosphoribosylformimino-5-aminoimidazole carboxamide ribotide isomerase
VVDVNRIAALFGGGGHPGAAGARVPGKPLTVQRRVLNAIRRALDWGVWRVVMGSAALANPQLVDQAVARFGEAFCVGLDARQGRVRVKGWTADSGHGLEEAGAMMAARGVSTLIVTNIERDGMLNGPDVGGAVALARHTGCRVVVSGGVSSNDDLRSIAKAGSQSGLEGVIVGKALYEHRVTVADALAALADAPC